MGLVKRMLSEFEGMYNTSYIDAPYVATAHICGLCLKCGEPKRTNHGLCKECSMWAYGDKLSS